MTRRHVGRAWRPSHILVSRRDLGLIIGALCRAETWERDAAAGEPNAQGRRKALRLADRYRRLAQHYLDEMGLLESPT